jgi:glycosyltransferase involved in cell wall biosynthesis
MAKQENLEILFISDNFPPEVNAPASRTYEHAKRWVASGARVTVITCAPNFPKGELHDGYRNEWRRVEQVDGIRVVRVKTFISGNEGFALRILDYVSFMLSAVFFGLFERRPDVIVGTSPQFFAAVGAWILSVFKARPFVFELRDLWPASIVTVGAMKPGLSIRLLEKLELFLYRRARAVISVTHSFVEDLVSRGIDREKIFVIRNGVDLERFTPRPRSDTLASQLGVDGRFVVAYLGTHGMAHALHNVVEASAKLSDDSDIVFLLVGHGAEKRSVMRLAQERGSSHVVFHDSLPKEMMPDLWSITDIALVHLKNDPVFSTVIPSKIFEAFGMGRPVLIVQPAGEAVDLVTEAGAGLWVEPEDPEALARACEDLRNKPERLAELSRNALSAADEHSRDRLAREMLEILANLVGKTGFLH